MLGFAALLLIVATVAMQEDGEAAVAEAGSRAFPGFYRPIDPPRTMPLSPFFEDGETRRTLADYRGNVVVLNLWARWCLPCVREIPSLDRLQGVMRDEDLVVLPMSVGQRGVEAVKPFYERVSVEFLPILIDRKKVLARRIGFAGLPTTLIIDREGKAVGRVEGFAEWDSPEVVAYLRACLARR